MLVPEQNKIVNTQRLPTSENKTKINRRVLGCVFVNEMMNRPVIVDKLFSRARTRLLACGI